MDDFVILHNQRKILEIFFKSINTFLRSNLLLELHPDKSKIVSMDQGIDFLGFRIFPHHRLLRKSKLRRFLIKMEGFTNLYAKGKITYDEIYDSLEGWLAYAKHANTYWSRQKILQEIEKTFYGKISSKEINRYSK